MTRLVWDQSGERFYEAGVDRGVFYPVSGVGVPWNGLISVDEKSSGGESTPLHYDGTKYLDLIANEDFQATITAFSAPQEFAVCDGRRALVQGLYATQQPRATFGLSYRTLIGNDLDGTDHGYKLHLAYGLTASPSARGNKTIDAAVDPMTMQWEVNAVPPAATTYKPTAHFEVDSTLVSSGDLTALENLLYGTAGTNPGLPTQAAVIALLS